MKHEALVHTVAMLLSAAFGLAVGHLTGIAVSDYLISVALAAMLYFVFICIDGKALREAFLNHRFTVTSVILNFIWTPFFAFGLGYLFFAGDVDVRIGLLLCLAAPCTDWYLVFTAASKGDMAVSSAILPLNMILQIVLVPLYLVVMFGADIHMESYDPIIVSLLTLAVPFILSFTVRRAAVSNESMRRIQDGSAGNSSLGQIIFLCIAVFQMFLSCSSDILDNIQMLVECIAPLLVFFVATTLMSLAVSSKLGWGFDQSTSLMFVVLARNSPLILAMMSSLFQNQPLVLAVLVICPLIELPFLSVASYLRGRKREVFLG